MRTREQVQGVERILPQEKQGDRIIPGIGPRKTPRWQGPRGVIITPEIGLAVLSRVLAHTIDLLCTAPPQGSTDQHGRPGGLGYRYGIRGAYG
ncbi:MAG: hypothetical protein LBQ30_04530 [Treponema sp.]|jgi:hypothetical protein|nr:hypothetical protein [Treponema sp.]